MPNPIVLYEDTEDEIHIPTRYEVCGRCNGEGRHDAWDGGMTSSELAEYVDGDPDFAYDYRAGAYSVPCKECHGHRVIAVPDEERCTPEQLQAWRDDCDAVAEDRAIRAAERRMGC